VSFESFEAFLAMGGHGFYVWLSYALAAAVVCFNIVAPLRRRRRFLAAQKGRQRRAASARQGPVTARDAG
jgi:heme exporter protein D